MYELRVLQTICPKTYNTMLSIKSFLDDKNIIYSDMISHIVVGSVIITTIESHVIIILKNNAIVRLHNSSVTTLAQIELYLINEYGI